MRKPGGRVSEAVTSARFGSHHSSFGAGFPRVKRWHPPFGGPANPPDRRCPAARAATSMDTMSIQDPVVQVSGLRKTYRGGFEALPAISRTISGTTAPRTLTTASGIRPPGISSRFDPILGGCHESRSWQSLILLGSGFSIFGGAPHRVRVSVGRRRLLS
jgi:hypothetical protein